MSKSIRFRNNIYLDASSIVNGRTPLDNLLSRIGLINIYRHTNQRK